MIPRRVRWRAPHAILLSALLFSGAVATSADAAPTPRGHAAKAKKSKAKKKKAKAKKIKVVNYALTGGLTASSVTVGQPVALVGQIAPRTRRPIRIEFKRNGAWVAGPSTVTSISTGAYRFTVPTGVVGQTVMHVVAPAKPKLRLKALSTAELTLTVKAVPVPAVVPTTPAVPVSPTGPLGDGPKDPPTGKAVFAAVFAYPRDQAGIDNGPTVAAVQNDIEAANHWFATQTDGMVQPRWYRNPTTNEIVVTKFELPHGTDSYATGDAFTSVVNDILKWVSVDTTHEHPVVFVPAAANGLCGQTGRGLSVVFLGATCPTPSIGDAWPGGSSFITAHEVTHAFGAAAQCAPNDDGSGHVRDDPNDILTAGSATAPSGSIVLDAKHNDYYDTRRSDCLGIESSPLWTTTYDPNS